MAKAKPASRTRKTVRAKTRRSNASRHSTKRKTSARAGGDDVRAQVHKLTLKALRDGDMPLSQVPRLAQQFIESAAVGLNNAVPQSSRNVLRQVVDGLTDAAAATAHSAKATVSSVAARSSTFIKHDAKRTIKDVRNLEGDFIAALERAGKSLKGAAKDEMDSIVHHARRAGTRIRPAAQSVLKAADGRLLELGKEAAGATTRAARSAVTNMLHGASGFLQGLGDAVEARKSRARSARKPNKKS